MRSGVWTRTIFHLRRKLETVGVMEVVKVGGPLSTKGHIETGVRTVGRSHLLLLVRGVIGSLLRMSLPANVGQAVHGSHSPPGMTVAASATAGSAAISRLAAVARGVPRRAPRAAALSSLPRAARWRRPLTVARCMMLMTIMTMTRRAPPRAVPCVARKAIWASVQAAPACSLARLTCVGPPTAWPGPRGL